MVSAQQPEGVSPKPTAATARYELLTLGDELLLGLTANGHLTFIGGQLGRHGALLQCNVTITDEADAIAKLVPEGPKVDLDTALKENPKLVEEIVPQMISLGELSMIMRGLLREGNAGPAESAARRATGFPSWSGSVNSGALSPTLSKLE